ncbi:MAG TPA: acyl-CoA dehydrogenase family protein [Dehalococcoidales bacterium]|nr:acyl-CoA dehydrogenase family protein [Dehalococcoidales bacterium]
MEFKFSPELEAFRQEVSSFLEKEGPQEWHIKKVSFFDMAGQEDFIHIYRQMAQKIGAKGWFSMHWPKEYGGKDASPFYRLILREELTKYHSAGYDSIGAGIVAPALILKGSEAQKKKHLPGIASGQVIWCETLSEPGHGSDMAAMETFAKEEGDDFVVNGQKIWTTYGHFADWNALIVRTDRNIKPAYKGLTFLLVDMKTPGITVNPIINMAGHHEFNEVFFDDVRIPKENVVGGVNQGWYVCMSLLDYERTADVGYQVAATLLQDIADIGLKNGWLDAVKKHRLAQLTVECEVAKLVHYHATWKQSRGILTNYDSALNKFGFELHQRITEFGMQVLGPYSQFYEKSALAPVYGRIPSCYLRSLAHSLEQGTSEIVRDVIAQRGLELPRLR